MDPKERLFEVLKAIGTPYKGRFYVEGAGIEGDDINDALLKAIDAIYDYARDNDLSLDEYHEIVVELVRLMRYDSFGLGVILYWDGVQFDEVD